MALLSIPPEVYRDSLFKEKYGVSEYEATHQLGNANPMKVIADTIKDIVRNCPDIHITVNISNNPTEEDKLHPLIEIETGK